MTPPVPGLPVVNLPDDVVLLDVREDDEWDAGHAPQALHVPMGQVSHRLEEITDTFPDPPIYVVCRSGMRSARITEFLSGMGLKVLNVEGGMKSWVDAGRPLVGETGAPPEVL